MIEYKPEMRFGQKLKFAIYKTIVYGQKPLNMSMFVVIFIQLIELTQINYFPIAVAKISFRPDFITRIQELYKYFSFEIITTKNFDYFFAFITTMMIIEIILIFVSVIVAYRELFSKKSNRFLLNFSRAWVIIAFIQEKLLLLFLPRFLEIYTEKYTSIFTNSNQTALFSTTNFQFNMGYKITFTILLIPHILLWIFMQTVYLTNSHNPCDKNAWVSIKPIIGIVQFCEKLSVSIFWIFDSEFNNITAWVLIICIFEFLQFLIRNYEIIPKAHFIMFLISGFIRNLHLSFMAAVGISWYQNFSDAYVTSFCISFLCFLTIIELVIRIQRLPTAANINKLTNICELYVICYDLIRNLPNCYSPEFFGFYCSVIGTHLGICENVQCASHELYESIVDSQQNLKKEENKGTLDDVRNKSDQQNIFVSLISHADGTPLVYKTDWRNNLSKICTMLESILLEIKMEHHDSPEIFLLKIYFDYLHTGNILSCLSGLAELEKLKPGMSAMLQIITIRGKIEHRLEKANYISNTYCHDYSDYNHVLKFHRQYNKFIESIQNCLKITYDIWNSILSQNTSPKILCDLGQLLITAKEITHKNFIKARKLEPRNRNLLFKYAVYQKEILHNEKYAASIFNSLIEMLKISIPLINVNKAKLGKIMVVLASADIHNPGEIVDANNEVESMLGYKTSEVIGRNVSMFQPPTIGEHHQKYMNKFVSTQNYRSLSVDLIIHMKSKQGYFVIILCQVKFLSTITQGVRFMGLFYPAKHEHVIAGRNIQFKTEPSLFLFNQDLKLIGITKGCTEHFNVPLSVVSQGSIRIDDLFQEIKNQPELINKLESTNGAIFELNLTKLSENSGNIDVMSNNSSDEIHEKTIKVYGKIWHEIFGYDDIKNHTIYLKLVKLDSENEYKYISIFLTFYIKDALLNNELSPNKNKELFTNLQITENILRENIENNLSVSASEQNTESSQSTEISINMLKEELSNFSGLKETNYTKTQIVSVINLIIYLAIFGNFLGLNA